MTDLADASPPAWRRAVVRALAIALIVGSLLVLVNHGDHLRHEPSCVHFYPKVALSYATPFVVSLVSTALASRTRGPNQPCPEPRS